MVPSFLQNLPGAEFHPPPVPPFPSHSSALTLADKNTDYASLNPITLVPSYQKSTAASSNPFCDEANVFPFTPQSTPADTSPLVNSIHSASAISLPRPASLFVSSSSEESSRHQRAGASRYSLFPLSSAALLSSLQAYSTSTSSAAAASTSANIATTSSTFLSDSQSYSASSATTATLSSSSTNLLSPLHSSPSFSGATATTIAFTSENTRHSCPVPTSFNPWHSVQANTTTTTTTTVPLASSVKVTGAWNLSLRV